MRIVHFHHDLVHADQVAAYQRRVVVEDAAVDVAGDIGTRRVLRALVAVAFLVLGEPHLVRAAHRVRQPADPGLRNRRS